MRVSYGPPGLKGVTHLVAVGADELDGGPDRMLKVGVLGAIAVAAYGAYTGQKTIKHVGFGAAAALGVILIATPGAFGKQVVVTTPPPTTTPTGDIALNSREIRALDRRAANSYQWWAR